MQTQQSAAATGGTPLSLSPNKCTQSNRTKEKAPVSLKSSFFKSHIKEPSAVLLLVA